MGKIINRKYMEKGMNMKLKVIYEDNHIIVVEKIPNVPSQEDKTGDTSMMTLIKEYIKTTDSLPYQPLQFL